MRLNNGEMTMVTLGDQPRVFTQEFHIEDYSLPWSTTAGSWKHKLFPKDVAAWTKTSFPSREACMISLC